MFEDLLGKQAEAQAEKAEALVSSMVIALRYGDLPITEAMLARLELGIKERRERQSQSPTQESTVPKQENRESFLEREPWSHFQNEILLREFTKLTEQERSWIDQMSDALMQETEAFRVTSGKPIGAQVGLYDHDYTNLDVKIPTQQGFHFETWIEYLQGKLSSAEFALLLGSYSAQEHINAVCLVADDYLETHGRAVVGVRFQSPANSTYVDDRKVSHRGLFFVRQGKFTAALRSADHARLLPFVYQCAAIKMNPEKAVFFDASLAGRKFFGEAPNPIAVLYDTPKEKVISILKDTATPDAPLNTLKPTNAGSFTQTACLNINASIEPVAKDRLGMHIGDGKGDRRGHRGKRFPRVQRGDGKFLRPV